VCLGRECRNTRELSSGPLEWGDQARKPYGRLVTYYLFSRVERLCTGDVTATAAPRAHAGCGARARSVPRAPSAGSLIAGRLATPTDRAARARGALSVSPAACPALPDRGARETGAAPPAARGRPGAAPGASGEDRGRGSRPLRGPPGSARAGGRPGARRRARRGPRSLARACTTGRIWRGDIVNTPGRTAVDPVTVKLLLYSAQAGSRVGIRLACAPGAGPRRSRRAREGRTKRSAAIPRAPCHSSQ